MDVVFLIGRILYAFLFLGSAFGHLTKSADMSGYASSKGIPAARLMVLGTGVQMLVGGLMVLLGIWGDLGSLLLALFLLGAALLMHTFWKETDPMSRQMEMIQFNKEHRTCRSRPRVLLGLPARRGADHYPRAVLLTAPLPGSPSRSVRETPERARQADAA